MEVTIPFLGVFEDAMLKGYKIQTARTKRYGRLGDTFTAFGQKFVITRVFQYFLSTVAKYNYRIEGLDSPEQFQEIWKRLHPRKGYRPDDKVWVHVFKRT